MRPNIGSVLLPSYLSDNNLLNMYAVPVGKQCCFNVHITLFGRYGCLIDVVSKFCDDQVFSNSKHLHLLQQQVFYLSKINIIAISHNHSQYAISLAPLEIYEVSVPYHLFHTGPCWRYLFIASVIRAGIRGSALNNANSNRTEIEIFGLKNTVVKGTSDKLRSALKKPQGS